MVQYQLECRSQVQWGNGKCHEVFLKYSIHQNEWSFSGWRQIFRGCVPGSRRDDPKRKTIRWLTRRDFRVARCITGYSGKRLDSRSVWWFGEGKRSARSTCIVLWNILITLTSFITLVITSCVGVSVISFITDSYGHFHHTRYEWYRIIKTSKHGKIRTFALRKIRMHLAPKISTKIIKLH